MEQITTTYLQLQSIKPFIQYFLCHSELILPTLDNEKNFKLPESIRQQKETN